MYDDFINEEEGFNETAQIFVPLVQDQFHILLFTKEYEQIFDYKSPTFKESDLDFVSFLKVSDIVKNSPDEPKEFFNIKIVFSMKIEDYLIDIASCCEMFLISVVFNDLNNGAVKINPLNALSAMYFLVYIDAFDFNSPIFSYESIQAKIVFPDNIITLLYSLFSQLCDPHFADYVAFVSSCEEVFITFGTVTNISKDDYYEVWDEALDLAAELDDTDKHVLSQCTDYLAVFSFLPTVKVVSLFSTFALDFEMPTEKEQANRLNNEKLMNPFIEMLQKIKETILTLYAPS